MKAFLARPYPAPVVKAASAHFDVTVREETAPMTAAEVREALNSFDVVMPTLRDPLGADAFGQGATKCKLLANFGVGYDHIDVQAANAVGIAVTNTPGAVTDATADIAMTLILMTARRAGEGERLVRDASWDGWHPTQMLGQHVSGKTVGILGMGRIGQAIAQRCRLGFGMNVVYYNRSRKSVHGCTQLATAQDVAKSADVVVVALSRTPETHHFVDHDILSAMQPHGFLINIARGDIIDETALIDALKAGSIAGAGLDVYEFEPRVPESLTEMENVVLLPHLGTATLEVRTDMGLLAVENMIAFKNGTTPPNLI